MNLYGGRQLLTYLPEVACSNKLLRKKLWFNSESGAHVLSLDILVKDAKFSADDDEAEEC